MSREKKKKKIFESIKKLKESGDDDKIIYAKTLYRYYCTLNSMGCILNPKQIPFEENKYGIHYLCSYLDGFFDTAKMSIPGVIEALGNDEPLVIYIYYTLYSRAGKRNWSWGNI